MSPTKMTGVAPRRRVLRSSDKPKPVNASATLGSTSITKKKRRRTAGADIWAPRRKPRVVEEPKPRAPPPTHFTCRICAEEQPVDVFIKWLPVSRVFPSTKHKIPYDCMSHLSRNPRTKNDPVCKSCIGASMRATLDQVGARRLSNGCLEPGCNTPWDFEFIMKFLPLDVLEQYNQGMLPVWKERESSRLFTCPNASCEAVSYIDVRRAAGYPHVSCPACQTRYCMECQVPWHKDLTCGEYKAKDLDEKLTTPEKDTLEAMQAKDGRRCPNCLIVIEKDGGCDSMYCGNCNKYFNWASAASAVLGVKTGVAMPARDAWSPAVICELDGLPNPGTGSAVPAP